MIPRTADGATAAGSATGPGSGATTLLLAELTRNGRISLRLACSRLTTWESLLVQHVLGRGDVEFLATDPDQHGPAAPDTVTLTRSPLAGLSLWAPGEPTGPEAEHVGGLRVPVEVLDAVAEETRVFEAREAADRHEADTILRTWEKNGELDDRLARLADWVERVESVYILIGRDVFSKSDAGTNTLTRQGLLTGLRASPVDDWRPADRLFVVLAYCLFVSGRSVRFEEFNGLQLSATGLREFLLDRHAQYCAALDRVPGGAAGLPLLELAKVVRELMHDVDRSELMRYRRINGLTFVKNERLLDFPLPRDPETMPELVARHGRLNLGVEPTGDVRADLRAMTLAAVALDAAAEADPGPAPPAQGAVGELLAAVVLSSIVATDADYGMSSSVRDLSGLRGVRPGSPDGVLALKKGDFFCCCLPHPSRMAEVGEETAPILWRSAQRMMYNRWHFAPGEYDRAEIPDKRHYFFPPQVPDIAEHAEHHHGGHVASRVRYTIRAPGAQVWHPPFTVFGHGYRGCYDIRLVRMEGPPFTTTELAEAVRHCSLVDELWRTLAQGLQSGTLHVPPVDGFDRSWYESRGWERLRPFGLASRTPAGADPV
ncbi:hypothetical protein OG401_38410 [Kitasatospora purpeofusca]|uniref:hypothetical protein n=1 Tax=Kitasatospora purpeofusca TaxID=67352 RepID=UPI002252B34D|nr:hypothetical protein [Kitasatospora purpeofusca]MCX4690100.1 hypothetical protein [Kitasatospora purpeofusca]